MNDQPIDPVAELKKTERQGDQLIADEFEGVEPKQEGSYLIFKMKDGNYTGLTFKAGKLVKVRDVGPETVLQLLLTHDGK